MDGALQEILPASEVFCTFIILGYKQIASELSSKTYIEKNSVSLKFDKVSPES